MGDRNYLNRLGDWIRQQTTSEATSAVFEAEVEYLESQLKAADKAGQKGAHDEVTRLEASRFVTGTCLILGDVLRLGGHQLAQAAPRPVEALDGTSADLGDVEEAPGMEETPGQLEL
jgi:hypothetical protein